jgi:hypothetical protein
MTIAAISLTLAVAGCSSVPELQPTSRDIGEKPADCRQVPVPEPRDKENLYVFSKRAQQVVERANGVIAACGSEWDRARRDFQAAKPGR